MSERALSDLEHKIVDDVATYGCSILSVFDPDGVEPAFSYSIGFQETLGQPEVIVFSLPKALRASMINEFWWQGSENGMTLADGMEISDLIEGFACVAREIVDKAEIAAHFGSAIWYSKRSNGEPVRNAFQIVWPGANQGLFPWDEGCVQSVIDDQPALYRTRHNS